MNIFKEYGIREVADVCLYSIELDENDNEIYIPVLYMDTLKVSTVEESTQSTSAQGGQGNPKLIAWDYGKDIVVTLEDALFTPASSSMNWAGKLSAKGLQLYLRYFFDRNTDNNVPDTCMRTAILTAEKFSDFLIIPDRWPVYEGIQCKRNRKAEGYVGGTSIFCWMVSGNITSDNGKKRVAFKDLILFYREQTQKWYFFNGQGPTPAEKSWWKTPYKHEEGRIPYYDRQYFPIYYQYGREVFEWIRRNIATASEDYSPYGEFEPLANCTEAYWAGEEITPEECGGIYFLTQNLFIDGYRKGCAKDKLYSELTEMEALGVHDNTYLPYRYFANVGVEYNTNILPPQDAIYSIDTALKDVFMHETIKAHIANRTFCIDTDENTKHSQYRYLEKYDETPLTVFINPKTMQPYLPNSYEYYRDNGQRITGNLAIIRKGDKYLKWTRERAKKNCSLGKQLIIDPVHYPGVYRLVGETYIRDRFGEDQPYQFEIPLCKLTADNRLLLQAEGEPTTFTMKLTALRRRDGIMMKLTSYELLENKCPCGAEETEIDQFLAPNYEVSPEAFDGDIDVHPEFELDYYTPRDAGEALIKNKTKTVSGFFKSDDWQDDAEEEGTDKSKVAVKIGGYYKIHSIDGTYREDRGITEHYLAPDEFTATITGDEQR